MEKEKRLTKKEIFSMFIRSNFLLGSFNFERVQAMGYCYVMIPAIKKLYGPGAKRNEALQRHLEWFNTHPWLTAPIFGVTAAMEEEMANNKGIDGSDKRNENRFDGTNSGRRRSNFLGNDSSCLSCARSLPCFRRKHCRSFAILFLAECHKIKHKILRIKVWLCERNGDSSGFSGESHSKAYRGRFDSRVICYGGSRVQMDHHQHSNRCIQD